MDVVKVNKKETKITLRDGSRYKAAAALGCSGCAFQMVGAGGFSYALCPSNGDKSLCADSRRSDGTSIIWVKRKDKHVGSN